MKALKIFLAVVTAILISGIAWLGLLYRIYGMQTLLFLVQSPPEYIFTYTKNIFTSPVINPTTLGEEEYLMDTKPTEERDPTHVQILATPIPIPSKYMITFMSHAYQKLNNCGPVSVSMAASSLGVTFDQFFAADILKGSYNDRNVAGDELVAFLETQGLKAIYRVNGKQSQVEQLVAQDIPVIVEQWLIKRGSGEYTGHYRVVRGYDQQRQIFTTNDSFNGPNFLIPYGQFEEWWRPFNRGYVVTYKPEQEELVKTILSRDWDVSENARLALEEAKSQVQKIGDGYAHFNLGTNAVLRKEYTLAERAYDEALKAAFPEHFLWYQFGPLETYYQQGNYDRVMQLTDRLLAEAGEMEEARYYRGLSFAKQGKVSEARSELEKSIQANPRYLKARQALGQL